MKAIPILVLATLASSSAFAQGRHDVMKMTCAGVKSLLQAEGSSIFEYHPPEDPGGVMYGRLVHDDRQCKHGERAWLMTIPVSDGKCQVNRCIDKENTFGR